ncbi:MAG: class I mannose-6-phosphate isomerase, partial [Lachnospiraceae bacterium]|nr:class I mannose-6-phosphate isomerase [Lachnospiraceae bacterium]
DYLWGGRRMKDVFGWNVPFDTFAESWLLSAHRDGISDVCIPEGGTMAFDHFLGEIGRERLGWKSQPYERFPMLVKFIDACQSLSVQVHPADTYALEHENDYGKNEMWYIMEADDDAFVYLGFERDTSPGEVRERIAEGTLTQILHKVPVKKGDSVMVPAGTVHAIGAGILILEVQQSSNATYRLYDYKRKGSDGKYRELHIDKALANMDYSRCNVDAQPSGAWEDMRGFRKIMLQQCKYFSVSRIMVSSAAEIVMDVSTFYSLVIIDGSGVIETELTDGPLAGQIAAREDFKVGDSFFIPAGNKIIRINGKCDMILSHI